MRGTRSETERGTRSEPERGTRSEPERGTRSAIESASRSDPGHPRAAEAAVVAEPIRDDEAARLFALLRSYRALVLAVSGGPDSMALMLLAARWCDQLGAAAPECLVVTVDHRLRPTAADEARMVAAAAARLGLPHRTVTWPQGAEACRAGGLQAAARAARYALLADVANTIAQRPLALVTAHTEDDQAETVVMRLKRGSGLDGLAGIPKVRTVDTRGGEPRGAVSLVRPLLEVAKVRLVATLVAADMPWVDDPSNDDQAFERVRVRQDLVRLAEAGLSAKAIGQSARRLARARAALDHAVSAFLARATDVHGGAYATIDRAALASESEEIRLRAILSLIAAFGGAGGPARLDQVEDLVGRLGEPVFRGETLGGAIVRLRGEDVVVYREAGRGGMGMVGLEPGTQAIWDGRFEISLAEDAPAPLEVGALGANDGAVFRAAVGGRVANWPVEALAAMPAFRNPDGVVVAVPGIGFAQCGDARADFIWPRTRRYD